MECVCAPEDSRDVIRSPHNNATDASSVEVSIDAMVGKINDMGIFYRARRH
jgi:hypothetical protein